METYKQDSEVHQWELDLFDTHIVPNSLRPGVSSEQNFSYYEDIFIREDEEPTQVSIFTENLFRPYTRDYTLGIEDEEEVAQHNASSSSCSSPGTNYHGLECSVEVSNEFSTIDGEIDRRFDQMVPIPHVPRINGEIPSVDEASFDHQRLIDRLQLYGLVERKVEGDGNCQFRALSDQLYGTPERHKLVRHRIVDQLRSHPEFYKEYVPMAYSDYLKKISKSGEWGDHVTLQAATDKFGCKIFVITSFKDTCYIEILPRDQKPNRGTLAHAFLFLSFWAEVHYNSIHPEGDLCTGDGKKKKKWWKFGNKH
ncbi:hypothetical protein ZIOFF_003154 [Zingiber officinale]|uniref:ubiquitinyl hydrolase 1 n=1 Tax=Zingiber officinale TaxID=94328 RepID=A0A8J5LZK7_ZINOF|nr:hypothetical protein ZIOFF_003154 [Zingiber officinale]